MKAVLMSILLIVSWTAIAGTVEAKPSQQKFSLGNTSLGETIDEFQSQFPKALCGSSLYASEIGLADVTDKGALTGCCLDRPMYVWKFSSRHIVPAASCHILATFYHSQLITLRYVVDAPSIESLLLEFTELYGSATFDGFTSVYSHNPQRVAAWIYGNETLNLSTIVLNNERPAATAVLVQLCKTDLSKLIQHR
jgi:hypothetical protein